MTPSLPAAAPMAPRCRLDGSRAPRKHPLQDFCEDMWDEMLREGRAGRQRASSAVIHPSLSSLR